MKRPNFTDGERFPPGGYVSAAKTDVARTFARIRRELAEKQKAEAEAMKNVKQMRKKA